MSDRNKKSSDHDSNYTDGTRSLSKNTLDEGVIAFGEWLMSAEDPGARCGPISLRRIANDDQVVLFDAILGQEVIVEMIGGAPKCGACHDDAECMHIGFCICVMQMNRRNVV